jgi:hypothetical protein
MTDTSRFEPSLAIKIAILWGVFLLGTLFHTQLALIPLFHGLDVTLHGAEAASIGEITPILWLMLAFFLVPMVLMVTTLFGHSRRYRATHFGITLLYTGLNLAHLVMDLLVTPVAWYQIALMTWLLVVGLLLNVVAYQWLQATSHSRHRLQST